MYFSYSGGWVFNPDPFQMPQNSAGREHSLGSEQQLLVGRCPWYRHAMKRLDTRLSD